MKKNFKKTLSLVLAVLMVMTAVPFSGLATEAECAHNYKTVHIAGEVLHWNKCELCGKPDYSSIGDCTGDKNNAKCGEYKVCTVCDGEYELVPHIFEEDTIAPEFIADEGTCVAVKKYYYNCINEGCDAKGTATFDSTAYGEHDWATEGVSNEDATCTEDGTMVVECNLCDATKNVPDVDSALGHDFTERSENPDYLAAPATCKIPAKYYFRCSECGESAAILENKEEYVYESEAGPVDHHFVEREGGPLSEKEVKASRTCTTQAVCYKVCDMCDQTSYDLGKPEKVYSYGELAPHVYGENTATNTWVLREADCIQDAIYSMCCNVCNAPEVEIPEGGTIGDIDGLLIKGLDQETADNKFKAFVKEGSALGHNPDKTAANATEYLAATCTTDGHYGKCYCSRCGLEYSVDSNGGL